jgi:import receptor subunit TOM70
VPLNWTGTSELPSGLCFILGELMSERRKPRNVLPLVNKSLAIFQWKQDIVQAESLCKEALQIDPDCDVAVATLAQLSLQQGKIDEAIGWFEKSARLARTEGELVNAITCEPIFSPSFHQALYFSKLGKAC